MLDLRPLRHFISVVELGSVSRAASHIGIAQPALSHQMTAMEKELGVKLLYRDQRGTRPTEAGRALYRHAQVLLRQLDDARRAVRLNTDDISGTVSVGLSVTTAEILSLPLLLQVGESHPSIRLQLIALPRRLLGEMLANGRLDIALLFDQGFTKGLTVRPLAIEEVFFVRARIGGEADVPAHKAVELAEVAAFPLLMPCRPHAARMLLETTLTQAGYDFNVVAEIDSVPSMVEAAEAGFGATVLPWSAVYREAAQGRLSVQSFAPPITREISLCRSDTVPLSAAVSTTWNAIEATVTDLVATGRWKGLTLLWNDRPPGQVSLPAPPPVLAPQAPAQRKAETVP